MAKDEVYEKAATKAGWGPSKAARSKAIHAKMGEKKESLELRSKKAGYYVHGHKNYGDVYEA